MSEQRSAASCPSRAPTSGVSEPSEVPLTQRSAFVLRVRPDRVDEYVEAHRNVWPEMLDALRGAGISNYTIFRDGNRVFGYFEAADLEAAERYLARQEISHRWQDAMAELLEERVPDGGPPPLPEVFRLD
jgi:L-rhamnose mutarotase